MLQSPSFPLWNLLKPKGGRALNLVFCYKEGNGMGYSFISVWLQAKK